MLGILASFADFLILLGVVFPPVAGVMLVDYYLLRTHRSVLDATRQTQTLPALSTQLTGWEAIVASIFGIIAGMTIHAGVPSFNSLMIASVIYGIIVIAEDSLRKLPRNPVQ